MCAWLVAGRSTGTRERRVCVGRQGKRLYRRRGWGQQQRPMEAEDSPVMAAARRYIRPSSSLMLTCFPTLPQPHSLPPPTLSRHAEKVALQLEEVVWIKFGSLRLPGWKGGGGSRSHFIGSRAALGETTAKDAAGAGVDGLEGLRPCAKCSSRSCRKGVVFCVQQGHTPRPALGGRGKAR